MNHRRLISLIVSISLGWAASAHADAVTYWNGVTVEAVTAGRPGGAGFLDMALVHAAMHDAVQAIQQRFEPYAATLKGSGSLEAAAGAAAYGVLVGIYPKQQGVFDAKYKEFLASGGLAGNAGLAVGQQAAAALLKHHRPSTALPDYKGGSTPGAWRPTPSFIGSQPQPAPFSPMANLYLMEAKPYALERPSQFRPEAPPALTSAAYLRDYNEVKALGGRVSATRTPAQTDLAYFWAGNYVSQWNGTLRSIADARKMDVGDSARLFALANLAAADAAIACWDSKRHFNFWRPVTAIREGENDGNAETAGDAAWEPLINTPNYPDYTSGANNVTAAMTTILERVFGPGEFSFSVTSDVPLAKQKSRTYKRFSDAAAEVVEARILLGIHFRFADTVARTQGTQVANWTFEHVLRPAKPKRAENLGTQELRNLHMKLGYTIVYVPDVAASLQFFESAFGLKRRFLHESGTYGELDTGETTLSFAAHSLGESNFPGGQRSCALLGKPLGMEIALVTTDVANAHHRAIACGARELSTPTAKPWGQIVSYVRAPDGCLIELCTPMSS